MTPLSAFPTVLHRPILCGGGNLPPAYGPLQGGLYGSIWMWDPTRAVAGIYGPNEIRCGFHGVIEAPESWHIPLDPASPWPARLARVAVWMMLGSSPPFAEVRRDPPVENPASDRSLFYLAAWRGIWAEPDRWTWRLNGKAAMAAFDLPTLHHHRAHPPEVALLLALYDVPEIRARMESTP